MFEIRKLEKERAKIQKLYEPDLAKAHKEKNAELIHQFSGELAWDLQGINAKISHIIGWRIVDEARALDVEIPPNNKELGFWEADGVTDLYYLSPKGRAHLRKLIDEEKARRFEVKVRWMKLLLPLITALAGLIGILTGFFSVLHRK